LYPNTHEQAKVKLTCFSKQIKNTNFHVVIYFRIRKCLNPKNPRAASSATGNTLKRKHIKTVAKRDTTLKTKKAITNNKDSKMEVDDNKPATDIFETTQKVIVQTKTVVNQSQTVEQSHTDVNQSQTVEQSQTVKTVKQSQTVKTVEQSQTVKTVKQSKTVKAVKQSQTVEHSHTEQSKSVEHSQSGSEDEDKGCQDVKICHRVEPIEPIGPQRPNMSYCSLIALAIQV
jgi:hypothetical protein